MIEPIPDMPAGTIGFRVWGRLHRSDYSDGLLPALREKIERGERLRALFEVAELDGVEPGALLEDAKAGIDLGLRHHSAWERTAIVTDVAWLRRAAELLGWMMPGEMRLFPEQELDAAKAWLA